MPSTDRRPVKMAGSVKDKLDELHEVSGHTRQYHLELAISNYYDDYLSVYRNRAAADQETRKKRKAKLST